MNHAQLAKAAAVDDIIPVNAESAAHHQQPLPSCPHAGTPNGWKASIALKEMEYPHKVQSISMSGNEQKQVRRAGCYRKPP